MKEKQEEQKDKFTVEERKQILKEKFKVGNWKKKKNDEPEAESLEGIINSVIDAIKNNNYGEDIKRKKYIRKYWFTKQIEDWKKKKNNEEPNDDELMDIVKKDLKVRLANTMLELRKELNKQKGINQGDIWFYKGNNYEYVALKQNDDYICEVSYFNWPGYHKFPPYKPFFMKNKNDHYKLNGVCIYKHGYDNDNTKWIMACFKGDYMEPQCKITFQTNEDNKITNVEIETKKDSSSKSTYTISLDDQGKVKQITKKGEAENQDKNYYNTEIKQLLFENDTNKYLTENIELELNKKQKEVFDTIKKHIGVVKEENKEDDNNNCKCCGFDLSCLKSCKGIF